MSGQMTSGKLDFKRYYESMKDMCGPYSAEDIPYKINYRGLLDYAREQGKEPTDLTDEEMEQFTYGVSMSVIRANPMKMKRLADEK